MPEIPPELKPLTEISNAERLALTALWGASGYLLGWKGQTGIVVGLLGAAWFWHRTQQKPTPVSVPVVGGKA